MKRVLITGGSGQLGNFVIDELRTDFEVTVFDRVKPTHDVAFIKGDLLDRQTISNAMADQDAVVHLAALDDIVEASDTQFMRINVMGTWNIFDLAYSSGVKNVVHCSSVAAVNISPENQPQYLPVDTRHVCDPTTAYGLSKLMGEKIARRFASLGAMQVICLRSTLIMQHSIAYGIAKTTAEADGTPPTPIAQDNSWEMFDEVIPGSRSFVDPRDAARAFRAALFVQDIPWDIFYVSAADTYSALSTLDVVQREFDVSPRVRDMTLYERNPRASIYDIARTKQYLDWEPQYCWQDLFSEVLSAASGPKVEEAG
jgi:nucleoside-diphosphate-sugar epimerase